jgi:CrcB protein
MWTNILLVAGGGSLGSVLRYLFGVGALRVMGPSWPYGTFAINVIGSTLMGLLAGWLAFRVDGGNNWRLLLGTGVLGGFTTFSAYSLDAALMIERREYVPAALYIAGSVALGLLGLFAGLWLARRVFA